MRHENVPQEWVDVLRAEMNVWPSTADLRAALAAVAPLIAAREREECAAMRQQMLDDVPKPRSYEMAHYCMGIEAALAAIRARGTP